MFFRIFFALAILALPANAQPYHANISAINPATLIQIADSDDVTAVRDDLRMKIFGSASLDTGLLPVYSNTYNVTGTWWQGKPNLASIQVWNVTTAQGVGSMTWRFSPTTFRQPTNGKCGFIIVGGHAQVAAHPPFQTLLLNLVAAGCEVVTIDMPLSGLNATSITLDTGRGKVLASTHNALQAAKTPTFNPLRLFVEPLLATVNDYEARGITNIGIFGLSGGGWTVDLYAALDERVDLSYSLAGSMPQYMRSWVPPTGSLGDWEQMEVPALGVDYLDLYVLGSVGAGRRHVNLYIANDSCCFGGLNANHFAPAVSAAVAGVGSGGSYAVAFDTTVSVHTVSNWAASWVAADMATRF